MWYKILEWFSDRKERRELLRDFNKSARNAFIAGDAPTLLEASISVGDSSFRHNFSKFLAGGFKIKALSGKNLNRSELEQIAKTILANEELVRKLVALGWDTLELHASLGYIGVKYALKDHLKLGGYIN